MPLSGLARLTSAPVRGTNRGMDWTRFCAAKADECERRAEKSLHELELMLEWMQMARDWREAARSGVAPNDAREAIRAHG